MKVIIASVALLTLLAACDRGPDPAFLAHDTKYSGVGATPSECVLDSQTGLYWEAKSDQPGLHDWRNTYTWFEPDSSHDELDYRGTADGGKCAGSLCDTASYATAANDAGLCGYTDWRIPTKDELFSISDLRRVKNPPTTNVEFFPYTQSGEYWTVNDYSFQHDGAWAWNFEFGHDRVDWKAEPKFVRLVRGEPKQLTAVKE